MAQSGRTPEPVDIHRSGSAWSITRMPPEIAEVAIDRPVTGDAKASDLQRHKDDEKKDEFQKALLVLQGADSEAKQKAFAATKLPELMAQNEQRTFKEIMPAVDAELIRSKDLEFHTSTATAFSTVIQKFLSKDQQKPARELIVKALNMASSATPEISNAWNTSCMEILVEGLNSANLQREIIPPLLERFGKTDAPVNGKRVAASLMGKLTAKLPEEVLSKRLFPTIEILSKDKDSSVRAALCTNLADVIAKLKDKDRISPMLQSLLEDTDPLVMSKLLGALGKAVGLVNPKDPKSDEFFRTTVTIFKRHGKKAYSEGNTDMLTEFTANLGQAIYVLSTNGVLSAEDKYWFLDAYLQLSKYGLPSTAAAVPGRAGLMNKAADPDKNMPTGFLAYRTNMGYQKRPSLMNALLASKAPTLFQAGQGTAATLALIKGGANNNSNNQGQNQGTSARNQRLSAEDKGWPVRANIAAGFVHFIKFAKPLVEFRHGLHPMIVDLMRDPSPAVRANMSQNIYPIIQFVGPEGTLLHSEVVHALADDNISVIENIMPNLGDILRNFATAKLISPDGMTNATVEIGGALLFCEERLSQSNDWRVHAVMLEQLTALPACLPGDYIFANFVPALFHRLVHMRQLPCRIAAAEAICAYLRHCRRSHQREEIRQQIKASFAAGSSVHDRMLFMFISKKIMEVFSRKYYRDHFFESTLAMTDDQVANVRLKAVKMMPDLKAALQMSEDDHLLKKLEEALNKIKHSETDRDVQDAIDDMIPAMEKVGVVLKGQRKGPPTQADLEDERKQKEEEWIASLEPKPNVMQNQQSKNAKAPPPPPPPKPAAQAPGPAPPPPAQAQVRKQSLPPVPPPQVSPATQAAAARKLTPPPPQGRKPSLPTAPPPPAPKPAPTPAPVAVAKPPTQPAAAQPGPSQPQAQGPRPVRDMKKKSFITVERGFFNQVKKQ